MIEGIRAALRFDHDTSRERVVSFLTDGFIGNELQILEAVQKDLGWSRIFSFGVGSSVNRSLLAGLARLGNGAVAYVGFDEGVASVVQSFYECISHPALCDITVDWGSLEAYDIVPERIPDLFVGRPVILTGRYTGAPPARLLVQGSRAGVSLQFLVEMDENSLATHEAIPSLWARAQIRELRDRYATTQRPAFREHITELALEFGLMSADTAFVAVDETRVIVGDPDVVAVPVPVPLPEGMKD